MKKILIVILLASFSGCATTTRDDVKNWGRRILSFLPGYSLIEIFTVSDKIGSARKDFSDEEEYYLGRAVAARILGAYPALQNEELNSYISLVGASLAANSSRPETFVGYHFQVLDASEINSMATPGGFIFVTKGLLQLVPDEDALASVLAHEISHVVARHGIKAIAESNKNTALMLVGKAASTLNCAELTQQLSAAFSGAVDDIFQYLLEQGYSREQEFEADGGAVAVLQLANYNALSLASTLQQLDLVGQERGSAWLSSHPSSEDRRRSVATLIAPNESAINNQTVRTRRFNKIMRKL